MEDTNLALQANGAVASQSSTYVCFNNDISFASRAIDGNTDGDYFNGSVTHTNADQPSWWRVDLLGPDYVGPGPFYAITSVKVYNRVDNNNGGRILNTEVQLQDASEKILDKQELPDEVKDVYELDFEGFVGQVRYVKVQKTDTNFLSLAEVEVYGQVVTSVSG